MNAPPVFDVGPQSLFYSPLWLRYYAVLPAGADPAAYTSAERIFDEKLPIYPNVAWTYSLRPDDVRLPDAPIVHPYLQTPVASFLTQSSAAWVDDESMAYFDEGSANFTYRTADLVVDETPLYELARRGPDGAPLSLGAPRVMGSGPPFARRPADAPGGRPRFGAYSRVYFAVAPATAAAFDPDASPDAAALLTAQGLDPQAYHGRVAANAVKVADSDVACFAATDFPASCTWLDSQAHIEDSAGRGQHRGHERHGLLAAGVLRGQGDQRTMSRPRCRTPRLTLLLAALAAARATSSGHAHAGSERRRGRPIVPARRSACGQPGLRRARAGRGRVRPAARRRDRAAADVDGLRRLRLRQRGWRRDQLSAG